MALLSRGLRGTPWVAALGVLLWTPAAAQTPEAGERAIKAAFVYNFTKFIAWPPAAFEADGSPFRVCVAADSAFFREMEGMLLGESIGGRPSVVLLAEAATARRCHLVYFGSTDPARMTRLLPLLKGAPVLTVGEGDGFLLLGGHIAFVREHDRVRFDVNKEAADRAGLTISSKLLRVARRVAPDQGQSSTR